jgi:nicotinate-nucleotide pyrophosphorylase (carboxylating)
MQPAYLTPQAVDQFIRLALAEDLGEGDHSTLGAVPSTKISKANLLVKDAGILAGVELAQKIFSVVDETLKVSVYKNDGDSIVKGEIAFTVEGKAQSILMAERLVLNCMQRMSGIATYTNKLCKLIDGTSARLMDTRKDYAQLPLDGEVGRSHWWGSQSPVCVVRYGDVERQPH